MFLIERKYGNDIHHHDVSEKVESSSNVAINMLCRKQRAVSLQK